MAKGGCGFGVCFGWCVVQIEGRRGKMIEIAAG